MTPSLASKVAIGGFLIGTAVFVAPMYYSAVAGRNPFVSKTMPVGGVGMLGAWLALLFV